MHKFLSVLVLFSFWGAQALAQKADSLFVTVDKEDNWVLLHQAQKGETLFLLGHRYHVPPAMLADVNGLTFQKTIRENTLITIPLGAYNQQTAAPGNESDARRLYYRVGSEDNLYRISRKAGVAQRTLQVWNGLTDNNVHPGQTLMVGWLLYDATPLPGAAGTVPATPPMPASGGNRSVPAPQPLRPDTLQQTGVVADTAAEDTVREISAAEQQYLSQTNDGQNVVTEHGTAAFFSMAGHASGNVYYAFHNHASRGSIIKVYNPGTGKTIFVKVLGPIPGTKQYANAIIGISGTAKAALGVRETKAWCELSYAGY